jgi:hypothetical protein
MRVTALICLALLIATTAMAASSGLVLGVDYSEWLPLNVSRMATDSSGALYLLSWSENDSTTSHVTKLSADGKTMLWQNRLGVVAADMAVTPNGGVFVITPPILISDSSIFVSQLNANGAGFAWTAPVGFIPAAGSAAYLAADSQGRAYVAGVQTYNQTSLVVRLTAAGDAVDYTALVPSGNVTALAVDQSGAAFVAGTGFLGRIAPDGTAGFSTTAVQGRVTALAVDAGGNAEAYSAEGFLRRFDTTGAVVFSKTTMSYGAMALDAARNAYVTGPAPSPYSVTNSLAPCGSELLSVFAPDGSILQNTYIAGEFRVRSG